MTSINATAGIKRIGGNETAYLKTLNFFADHYHSRVDAIRELIEKDQLQEAEEHCHALKGVAGNIGAQENRYNCEIKTTYNKI